MYEIIIEKKADKYLSTIPSEYQERIRGKIDELANNPFPKGAKKLKKDDDKFSLRTGPYRIVYKIIKEELLILVVKIGHRKDIYN